jgi:branched-chain amino acid transport system ATP-binding protein
MAEPLLQLQGLGKQFGGVQAVKDLSFTIDAAEIVGLIGPNGSGKSTSVNLISGTLPPSRGDIRFDGASVSHLSVSQRVPLGLARTFQTTSVFPEFSVHEQVLAACHVRYRSAAAGSIFRSSSARQEARAQHDKVDGLLDFVGLSAVAGELASAISSAQQRLLMIATALATEPRLVLLDEPAAGMVAQERKDLAGLIQRIRKQGTAVLVIEHHMGLIMEVCSRIVVLNFGQKIAEGTPQQIQQNPAVVDAYLGTTA